MEGTQSKQAEGAITKEVLLTQVKTGSFTIEELCKLFDHTPISEVRMAILDRFKSLYPGCDFMDWLLARIEQFAKGNEWDVLASLFRCAHHVDTRAVSFCEGVTNQLVTILDSNFGQGRIPAKDYNDLLVIFCGAMVHRFSLYTWRAKDFFHRVLEKEDWFLPEFIGIVKRILRVIGCMGDTSFLALLRERGLKPILVPRYGFSTFFEFSDSYQQIIETEGLRLMVIRHLEILEGLPK